jgi:hypothetical protein
MWKPYDVKPKDAKKPKAVKAERCESAQDVSVRKMGKL